MYKVIIADDEPLILLKEKTVFSWEDYGFSLEHATTSSEELFDLIISHNPHVVFLDINMPGLSGIDVMKKVKRAGVKCKFIIVSGYTNFSYAQEAISLGVFEYLVKPVSRKNADDVLERLKSVLDEENGIQKNIRITRNDNVLFEKMINYINEHFCEDLYLNELANKFGINLTYSCYLFNKNFDCTFKKYVRNLRMNLAASLIIENNLTINQIAEKCGYDYCNFNKIFKKHFGITPKQYKLSKS